MRDCKKPRILKTKVFDGWDFIDVFFITKILSEMEVTPRNKMLTLLSVDT